MKSRRIVVAAVSAVTLLFAAGCGDDPKNEHAKERGAREHKDEGLVKLSDAEAASAGVKTEALEALKWAIQYGGDFYKMEAEKDPAFGWLKPDRDFRKIVGP